MKEINNFYQKKGILNIIINFHSTFIFYLYPFWISRSLSFIFSSTIFPVFTFKFDKQILQSISYPYLLLIFSLIFLTIEGIIISLFVEPIWIGNGISSLSLVVLISILILFKYVQETSLNEDVMYISDNEDIKDDIDWV